MPKLFRLPMTTEEDSCPNWPPYRQQYERDWLEFEKAFAIRKDVAANRQDPSCQDAFYFFTAGAHAEFSGLLGIKRKSTK